MRYFIANWKANKTENEATSWIDIFLELIDSDSVLKKKITNEVVKIIICPPFPFLSLIKNKIGARKNIVVGSQDLSAYPPGTYTGEVPAEIVSGLTEYAIIGHSERVTFFHEDKMIIEKKINRALSQGIQPIYCFQGIDHYFENQATLVAYEPPWAISKGYVDSMNAQIRETPDSVVKIRQQLKINADKIFIYGGSVNLNNVPYYLKQPSIDGLLVGGASLEANTFYKIVRLV